MKVHTYMSICIVFVKSSADSMMPMPLASTSLTMPCKSASMGSNMDPRTATKYYHSYLQRTLEHRRLPLLLQRNFVNRSPRMLLEYYTRRTIENGVCARNKHKCRLRLSMACCQFIIYGPHQANQRGTKNGMIELPVDSEKHERPIASHRSMLI